MAIERLDPREELPVVPARDEDLVVRANRGLEDAERTRAEFVFLELGNFVLAVLVLAILRVGHEKRVRREGYVRSALGLLRSSAMVCLCLRVSV